MFLSIEGIDGSGKTTLCGALQDAFPDAILLRKKEIIGFCPKLLNDPVKLLYDETWGSASDRSDILKDRPLSDIFIMAGWFHLIQQYVLDPGFAAGKTIVMDGWYYKFLGRYIARGPDETSLLNRVLRGLSEPQICFYLDIKPELAAKRKHNFTASECGVLDGYKDASIANFIAYQTLQKSILDEMAKVKRWCALNPSSLGPQQLAERVIKEVAIYQQDGITN